ncbi:serine hydrolase domain-containing protein [Sediminicola luteus]|nr:serine hydrolase domain-containing protein [Sediminicola luteus]
MKYKLFFVFALVMANHSFAQSPIIEFIDSLALNKMKNFQVPGLAIGIIQNDTVLYAKGLGVKSINDPEPLTQESLFHMASVSKPFTATALMQLESQGKLELKDKLFDWLPEFKMRDPEYKLISLKHILTHTSGIPDVVDYQWDKAEYDSGSAFRYVRSFSESELDFTPGTGFNYSNAAFDLLAAVIQKASGQTFEDYLQDHILGPTRMVNSTFLKKEVPPALATSPHVFDDKMRLIKSPVYPYNRRHAPSSTLHSNIDDILQWARLQLQEGNFDGKQIISQSAFKALTKIQKPLGEDRGICLGWFQDKINDEVIIKHSGGDEGYSAFFGFLPEKKLAITIMANNDLIITEHLATVILHKILNGKSLNYKTPIHIALGHLIYEKDITTFKETYYAYKNQHADAFGFGNGYLDGLGYQLLDDGMYEKAVDIFKLQVSEHPEEPGFYDSVGDGYRAWERQKIALNWYLKANQKDPEGKMSKEKIDEIKIALIKE